MTRQTKLLIHQIHPAKLLTDIGTSFASAWLLWEGRWTLAVAVGLLPCFAVSAWLMRFVDLTPLQGSWLGRYVMSHMPRRVVTQRLAGQLLAWIGAASHEPWLIPFGYIVVVFAWLNGLWEQSASSNPGHV